MGDLVDELVTTTKEHWHRRTGLVAALALVFCLLLVTFAGIDLEEVSKFEWAIISGCCLLISAAWWKTRMPRVPSGKFGFAVALDIEDPTTAIQLQSDFIFTLRQLISDSPLRTNFCFIEVPNAIAREIVREGDPVRFVTRANIHFLLYGRVRLRTIDGAPSHIIDLHGGTIRHGAIRQDVSNRLASEFGSALPGRLFLRTEGGLPACEFAAKHIDAAARYIIGTAAAYSGEFEVSERLLREAEDRLAVYVKQAEGASLAVLLNLVQERLRELYSTWMNSLGMAYTLKREIRFLEQEESVIGRLRRLDPANYSARLSAAMCAFMLRRDVTEATREIEECRGQKDATWQYSLAFLQAYQGNLDAAYRTYQRAFSSSLSEASVPTQSEEFTQIVLDAEPDRVGLYFALGLINQRAKGDLASALRDFTTFIDNAGDRYPTQVEAAKKWTQEIAAVLSVSGSGDATRL